ncbi:hypothetical protein [Paracoccus maritimus]|uniref:hypothetical protein n=1 Tax=Paracoccus maritimus TaxID=2933292 RepID=UPI0021A4B689|nr:hypothetical protein [Paracoccus sp. YLB-12]
MTHLVRALARFLSAYAAVIFFIYLSELVVVIPSFVLMSIDGSNLAWVFRCAAVVIFMGMILDAHSDAGMKPERESIYDVLVVYFFGFIGPLMWMGIHKIARLQVSP